MSNETTITITGNLVDDPELRFTPPGSRSPGSASRRPRYRDNATGGVEGRRHASS